MKTANHRRVGDNPMVCETCDEAGRTTDQSLRHVGEDDLPVCVCSHMLEAHTEHGCMDCGSCGREWGEEAR